MRIGSLKTAVTSIWSFLVRNWIDVLLFLGFASSMGVFLVGAWNADDESAASAVASLETGAGSRRAYGINVFAPASIGTQFFNMDAIWVGPKQSAVLRSPDGVELELSEKTLVVLRKPFLTKAPPEARFHVLQGKAFILGRKWLTQLHEPINGFRELPKEADVLTKSGDPNLRAYPLPDAVIVAKSAALEEQPFTWARPVSGYLVVSDVGSVDPAQYIPLNQASYEHVSLKPGRAYLWQVIDGERNPVIGPYRFMLQGGAGALQGAFSSEAARAAKGQKAPGQTLRHVTVQQ